MKTFLRILLKSLGGILLVLVLVAALLYLHTQIFPLSLESRVRRIAYRHLFFRPVVIDGWGMLMTRVLPLDNDHLTVGLSTTVGTLRKSGDSFELCSRIGGHGIVHDLVLRENILYVAAGTENLAWYDFSDPCAPKKLGSRLLGGYGFGIHLRDDRLYLANRIGGMVVFTLKENGAPKFEHVAFGDMHASDDQPSPWLTCDITEASGFLVAADGNKGILVFDPDVDSDGDVRAFFSDELTSSEEVRNIDPAPLRVRAFGRYVYAALREKGVAVLSIDDAGQARLLTTIRPDDGEVLDLLVQDKTLFVPSTRGKVYAYDLSLDPERLSVMRTVHAIGGDRYIHSLGARNGELYASSIGVGLYQFVEGSAAPVGVWRPPDEVRSLAKVGQSYAAALGSGGIGLFAPSDEGWRQTAVRTVPSFAFSVAPLNESTFAASCDVAGTEILAIEPDGAIWHEMTIPTPEHAFSSALLPPDELATANGVYGVLRYRLDLENRSFEELTPKTAEELQGYAMRVNPWRGGFIGTNIAGSAFFAGDFDPSPMARKPSFCFAGGATADGTILALACRGDGIWLHGKGTDPQFHRHSQDVVALLPASPYLIVGGFPGTVTVYQWTEQQVVVEAELAIPGVPYQIIQDGDQFLIAAGTAGVYALTKTEERWELRKIPLINPLLETPLP